MISGEDDHWKLESDVTDFGGIQIPHFGARVEQLLVGSGKKLFSWLLFVHHRWGSRQKLQILRTKCGPRALYGAEASLISKTDMTSLRTAFCAAA